MSKIIGSITGANKAAKGAKQGAAAALFKDFSSNTPFGSGTISRTGGMNFGGGPGASLAGGFQHLADQFGAQAGAVPSANINLDPNAVIGAGMQQGQAARNLFGAAGMPFLDAAQNYASSLSGFNPDQFAQTQFDRLENLARPGEETQTQSALNSLFSRGRLGANDTAGSRMLGQLDQSQLMARDSRGLQAIGLAQEEAQNRAGIAGQMAQAGGGLFGQGENLATSELGRFLSSLTGGMQIGGFQDQLSTSLLQRALGSTGGISAALAPTNQGIQNMLSAGQVANSGNALSGQVLQQGGAAAGSAMGSFTGGLLGAVSPFKIPGFS